MHRKSFTVARHLLSQARRGAARVPCITAGALKGQSRLIHVSSIVLAPNLPPIQPSLPIKVPSNATPLEVISTLRAGNQRFMENKRRPRQFADDICHLTPTPALCTIIADAHFEYPMQTIFDAADDTIKPVLVTGGSVEDNDAFMGSAEFLVEFLATPVLLVMGHHDNEIIKVAVRKAMLQAGRTDLPEAKTVAHLESLVLIQKAMPAALDALAHSPRSSYDDLVYQANLVNIWRNIEKLLSSSMTISQAVSAGKLQVHAAFFEADTKKVVFLGEHVSQMNFLATPPKTEFIRTAQCPPVAAEEALAELFAGNKRYLKGIGGQIKVNDPDVLDALCSSGQNPVAVVVGCADSRAPIELIFDMRPGDLFVLRNAGNSCNDKAACSLKGSMDYAIANLRCKLVLVMGHTQCGAVTAAVDLVRRNVASTGMHGIDRVLSYISSAAERTVREMPDATIEEQVARATRLNIHDTMGKILRNSEIAKAGVEKLDVIVHGAIYNLKTGEVEWMGQHPDIEEIVPNMPAELHRWKTQPYVAAPVAKVLGRNPQAKAVLERLKAGNERFMLGKASAKETDGDPFAVIISSSENRSAAATLFDEPHSNFVVQRTLGHVESDYGSEQIHSLEFAFLKYKPPVFLIVVDHSSTLPDVALAQLYGVDVPTEPMRQVLSSLMVSCQKVVEQVEASNERGEVYTRSGRRTLIKSLTAELDTYYAIEQIMQFSKTLRDAVKNGELEIHVAVLDSHTGRAELLGEHPMLQQLLDLHA